MLKLKKEKTDEPEVVTLENAIASSDDAISRKGVVTVTWRLGSREYSKDIHGEDYKKLAKEFSDKVGGSLS